MSRTRCLLVLSAAFACAAFVLPTLAQDQGDKKPKVERGKGKGIGAFGGLLGGGQGPLVPDAVGEKLKLSAEQKSAIAKLENEYKDKSKPLADKLAEAAKKAVQDKDREALQGLREQGKALQELRTEYRKKVVATLNDEQKKNYQEASQRGGGFGAFGGFIGGRGVGQILAPALQQRLNLSDEQKDKLNKLQKETEGKLNDILTPEQRKQLEELRKAPARPNIRPKADNIQQLRPQLQQQLQQRLQGLKRQKNTPI